MKIVFFGTSEIGLPILEDLITNHQVLAVVTSPDRLVGRKQILESTPIANLALAQNIPTFKPEKARNNPEFLDELRNLSADIFIVVSYGKILPEELLGIPPLQTINVHFSLLPKYRGAAPVQFALLNGETKTGTSIFILDKEVDHGPVLATAELPIEPTDTNPTLQSKLAKLSSELLLNILPNYAAGKISPIEQDHTQATFTKLINKEDGKIDWQNSSQQIYNRFRAFQSWPGIYTTWEDKIIKIIECKPATTDPTLKPGQTHLNLVGCGQNTALELITIQLEGKKPVPIQDFLNGHPNFGVSTLN